MDRSVEKNLNPYDTHAIEAAMQIKEGGEVEVEEIVAVTMGPESAVRALHKAVSLGADRSVHLTDPALAGSDVAATGYALAQTLKRESPDLVLLGQQSDDGECYTIGAVVAEHLRMPSLTQVIKMDVDHLDDLRQRGHPQVLGHDGADRVALAVVGLLAQEHEIGALALERLSQRVAGGGHVGAGQRGVGQVHRAIGAQRHRL